MKNYKLGINLDLGFDVDMSTSLHAAKKAGFEAFFITWRKGKSDLCRELASLARKEGMIFQSIHAPWDGFDKLWEKEDEEAEKILAEQMECIRLCKEVEVPLMIIHPYVGFHEYVVTEVGIKNFAKLVKVAEECGVDLAFENVEGEVFLAEIIKRLGDSPRVGLCWDSGHEQCYNYGHDIPGSYANGKLFGTHFNDSLGITDINNVTWLDDVHLLPYDGINDWKGIMERLKKAGFDRDILTFELTIHSKPGKNTHDKYAAWSLQEYMNQAYARAKRVVEEQR